MSRDYCWKWYESKHLDRGYCWKWYEAMLLDEGYKNLNKATCLDGGYKIQIKPDIWTEAIKI